MGSFKEVQEILPLCLEDEIIDDEEFILLYEACMPQNPSFPHSSYGKFSIVNKDPAECKADFRVEKGDIPILVEALRVPPIFKCVNGTICDGTEGLCVVLKRFAYPCRYSDMIPIFGRSVSELSIISNEVIDWIYTEHGHRVTQWNHSILDPTLLSTYANAIFDKGAALDNCFGFIDGTVRPICRPVVNQRTVYNGHKRVHSLKFQSVTLPNGLIAHLFGPVEGRMHDARMLAVSQLYDDLEVFAFNPAGREMCLYGDPAYPLRVHLQAPFRFGILTRDMEIFNESMSAVRSSVEWLFADVINYFKFLDFKKNLKIGLSQVGKMYLVCAILRNALTCLYSNTTAGYFGVDPPTLNEYFS
ncbi:uncharacterized protein LOC141893070 [Acropora palmata]|uniref:uncharacterized protein LOC141893070 n=2 Tax=Acropora TaxID=6127 RepID=UPI003D9FD791